MIFRLLPGEVMLSSAWTHIPCGSHNDKTGIPGILHSLDELFVIFSFRQSAYRDVEDSGCDIALW